MGRKRLIWSLLFFIALLLAINLFIVFNEMVFDRQYRFGRLFHFDTRLNIPFFFSLFLQLANLLLLFNIVRYCRASKSQTVFWRTLFLAFFLFALDEAFYIHQHFKMSTFGTIASYDRASWSHYLWVIPYFLVFGSLIAVLFIYSTALPTPLKRKLFIAGSLFLFGAVAMEFAGTFYAVIKPEGDIYLLLIKSLEATLQMVGSVMFMDTFATHLYHNKLEIRSKGS
ncbi:MAG TPA: hypothetical protein VGD65_02775 [Chryseosolibacter sp.]